MASIEQDSVKEKFEKALVASKKLHTRYSASQALASIIDQLTYLIALESGETRDRSRLPNITIGILAAREIEDLDEEVAALIHEASAALARIIPLGTACEMFYQELIAQLGSEEYTITPVDFVSLLDKSPIIELLEESFDVRVRGSSIRDQNGREVSLESLYCRVESDCAKRFETYQRAMNIWR